MSDKDGKRGTLDALLAATNGSGGRQQPPERPSFKATTLGAADQTSATPPTGSAWNGIQLHMGGNRRHTGGQVIAQELVKTMESLMRDPATQSGIRDVIGRMKPPVVVPDWNLNFGTLTYVTLVVLETLDPQGVSYFDYNILYPDSAKESLPNAMFSRAPESRYGQPQPVVVPLSDAFLADTLSIRQVIEHVTGQTLPANVCITNNIDSDVVLSPDNIAKYVYERATHMGYRITVATGAGSIVHRTDCVPVATLNHGVPGTLKISLLEQRINRDGRQQVSGIFGGGPDGDIEILSGALYAGLNLVGSSHVGNGFGVRGMPVKKPLLIVSPIMTLEQRGVPPTMAVTLAILGVMGLMAGCRKPLADASSIAGYNAIYPDRLPTELGLRRDDGASYPVGMFSRQGELTSDIISNMVLEVSNDPNSPVPKVGMSGITIEVPVSDLDPYVHANSKNLHAIEILLTGIQSYFNKPGLVDMWIHAGRPAMFVEDGNCTVIVKPVYDTKVVHTERPMVVRDLRMISDHAVAVAYMPDIASKNPALLLTLGALSSNESQMVFPPAFNGFDATNPKDKMLINLAYPDLVDNAQMALCDGCVPTYATTNEGGGLRACLGRLDINVNMGVVISEYLANVTHTPVVVEAVDQPDVYYNPVYTGSSLSGIAYSNVQHSLRNQGIGKSRFYSYGG